MSILSKARGVLARMTTHTTKTGQHGEMQNPGRGYRMDIIRTCQCCDKPHDCRETFREMVDRCMIERDGSPIIH